MKGQYWIVCTAVSLCLQACAPDNGAATASGPQPVNTNLVESGATLTGTITDGAGASKVLRGIIAPTGSGSYSGMAKFWTGAAMAGNKRAVLQATALTPTGDIGFSAPFQAYANSSAVLPGGSLDDSGALQGQAAATQVTGTYTLNSSGDSGQFVLTYDTAYTDRPLLATLAGDYTFTYLRADRTAPTLASFSLDDKGTIPQSAPDSDGCAYSGTVSTIDVRHNVFGMSLDQSCPQGSYSLRGLATYLAATADLPARLDIIVDDGRSRGLAATASQ